MIDLWWRWWLRSEFGWYWYRWIIYNTGKSNSSIYLRFAFSIAIWTSQMKDGPWDKFIGTGQKNLQKWWIINQLWTMGASKDMLCSTLKDGMMIPTDLWFRRVAQPPTTIGFVLGGHKSVCIFWTKARDSIWIAVIIPAVVWHLPDIFAGWTPNFCRSSHLFKCQTLLFGPTRKFMLSCIKNHVTHCLVGGFKHFLCSTQFGW